ncbi:hypothetical protein TCDM_04417 [Trypanosoma cruzi Dm28c]|uniref:SB domain-containing protein n=1 Tax=Trypanosoma cruzi Dm28c TaxID=1416333 RepID=V5BQQ0_TRYCR|nr:hypothetical protein TCDM_04417 [Trypanosoma cruzi Dm28c]KAF8279813.1 putative Vps23 core domain containing protein [Trypanosoma cruzi]
MGEDELRRCMSMDSLREHYSQAAATEINKYITDFMVYLGNFGNISCSFSMKANQRLFVLQCPLFVTPPRNDSTGAQEDNKEFPPLFVEVYFPPRFPSVPPCCSVNPTNYKYNNVEKWSIRQPSRIITSNGSVNLSELSLLSGATPPYSLLEILLALTEQFEIEFPLIPANQVTQSKANTQTQGHRRPSPNTSSERRSALERRAAELLMLHLLSKAEGYLDTREQSLNQFERLYRCGGAMREARGLLEEKKTELLAYSPAVDKVEDLVGRLTQLPDNLEVHSKCIEPVDDLQTHALELLSEIHALDDALELLERSLKAGQLSCEEYVRRVSDMGRKQFEARFLFARVAEAVNRSSAKTAQRLPSIPPRVYSRPVLGDEPIKVPTKLNSLDLLLKEFPEVGSEMVKAVLNVVDGNLSDARVQLRAMLS